MNRLSLDLPSPWTLAGVRTSNGLFPALADLLPEGAVLYIEGTSIATDLRAFLEEHAIEPEVEIERGTLFPRPSTFHIPVTGSTMERLQTLADRCAEPEICEHLHAYLGEEALLTWFDAFFDPLHLSRALPEERVRVFAAQIETEIS